MEKNTFLGAAAEVPAMSASAGVNFRTAGIIGGQFLNRILKGFHQPRFGTFLTLIIVNLPPLILAKFLQE